MDIKSVLIGMVSAFGFALWPIVGKYSGASGGWFITIVSVGTLAVVGAFSAKELVRIDPPEPKAIMWLLIAGLFNGLSCYLYSARIEELDKTQTAPFVNFVVVCIVILAPVFSFFLNDSLPTRNQLIGFVLIILGVCFFAR